MSSDPVPISFRHYLCNVFKYHEDEVFLKMDAMMPCFHGQMKRKSKECKGDKRVHMIRHHLNHMGLERSTLQRQFHEAFLESCSESLYKDDTDVDMEAVLKRNGWSDGRQSVLCLTPRRFGKTTGKFKLSNDALRTGL